MRGAAEWPAGAKPISRNIQYDDLNRVMEVDYDSGSDIQVSPLAAEMSAGNNDPVPLLRRPQPWNFWLISTRAEVLTM
jgi:hypothetical protein